MNNFRNSATEKCTMGGGMFAYLFALGDGMLGALTAVFPRR